MHEAGQGRARAHRQAHAGAAPPEMGARPTLSLILRCRSAAEALKEASRDRAAGWGTPSRPARGHFRMRSRLLEPVLPRRRVASALRRRVVARPAASSATASTGDEHAGRPDQPLGARQRARAQFQPEEARALERTRQGEALRRAPGRSRSGRNRARRRRAARRRGRAIRPGRGRPASSPSRGPGPGSPDRPPAGRAAAPGGRGRPRRATAAGCPTRRPARVAAKARPRAGRRPSRRRSEVLAASVAGEARVEQALARRDVVKVLRADLDHGRDPPACCDAWDERRHAGLRMTGRPNAIARCVRETARRPWAAGTVTKNQITIC